MSKALKTTLCLFLVLLVTLPVAGQTNAGRLTGTVSDASGAVIPNAKVVASNLSTGAISETTTGVQGVYVFPALAAGTYSITVEASGFRKTVHTSIGLSIGATVSDDFAMEVGAVTETVTVEANVQRIQTEESHIGRVVQMKDINTLPQLARSPIILSVYQPGVQNSNPGDPTFARINGTRQGSSNATLDGIDVNDSVVPRLGLSMTANNSDSIAEVRLITNGGKAEFGRNAGGQVEMVTRSGSNAFHGNLFDYLRNTKLNANTFFNNATGTARPLLIQNIFGGSIGGPIVRNRLFFFYNTQLRRTTQTTVRLRTVLTPTAKQGIYRWTSPGSTTVNQFNIPANDPRRIGIDRAMADIFKVLPDPNNFDVGDSLNTGGFRFNNPTGSQENQNTWRFDFNVSANHKVFGRYSRQTNDFIDSLNNADARYPGFPNATQGGIRWGNSFGHDWTITPTMVNEFRYGHQSALVGFFRPGRLKGPSILSNSFTDPYNPGFASGRNSPVDEWTDNLSKVRGNHTFKVGFNARWTLQNGYSDGGIYPNVSLTTGNGNSVPATIGPTTTGGNGLPAIAAADRTRFESLYNDVLGRMNQVTQTFYSDLTKFQAAGSSSIRNYKFRDYGAFIQDDWRVNPNLTVNVGLRWEFSKAPYEQDKQQGCIDKVASINASANISDLTVTKCSQWYNNDYNNFAPRLGFAWTPKTKWLGGGDNKTVIRGSYGIFFDRIVGATTSLVDSNTPGFTQQSPIFPNGGNFPSTDNRVSDGLTPFLPAQPGAPVLNLPATRSTSIVVFDPNLSTGYVQHISLGVQREIARNTILELGYVGTRGIKLFMDRDLNQQRIYGDYLTSFQQLQAFQASGTAVPATNTLVRIFGTPAAAITALGATTVSQGLAYTGATTVDRNNFNRYAAAGVSQFYLRNYPQYNQLIIGNNDGRSYYNSMQLTVRRQVGALRGVFNYTWSNSIDNISVDGNGFTSAIDNNNLVINRGRGDADIPHAINYALTYTLPIGKGHRFGGNWNRFMDSLFGGWDIGTLGAMQSGRTMTFSSGRVTGPYTGNTWANYSGDRNIGGIDYRGDGVFWFKADQLTQLTGTTNPSLYPVAGAVGSAGRNSFRGPRYTNFDVSLVKTFKITEKIGATFRVEGYNIFNHVNFNQPSFSASNSAATNGKISTDIAPRIFQMALRIDF